MAPNIKQTALTENDNLLWSKFMDIVKADLANKLVGASWSVTMEIKFSDIEDVEAVENKLRRVKIKGKEDPLFLIDRYEDRFVIKYIVEEKK